MKTRAATTVLLACSLAAAAALAAACSDENGSAPPTPRGAATDAPANAPAPTAPDAAIPTPSANGYHFAVAGVHFNAPAQWLAEAPTSMRKAQFDIPSPPDSPLENGEVAFFHFGPTEGGDAASNLDRWAKQMLGPDGAPAPIDPETVVSHGLRITTAVFEGTYQSGMPGAPPTPKPGWMLVGGIVENGPEGTIFIRIAGPAEVIGPAREQAIAVVRSAHAAH